MAKKLFSKENQPQNKRGKDKRKLLVEALERKGFSEEKLMTKAFAALYETAQEKHCTLRMGAYVVALQRLIDAEVIKGLFP